MSEGKLRVKELKQDMVIIQVGRGSILPKLRDLLSRNLISEWPHTKIKNHAMDILQAPLISSLGIWTQFRLVSKTPLISTVTFPNYLA
jgi:hypothetical protein